MIALVDYGAGNLTSVRKALTTLGAEFETPREPAELQEGGGAHRAGRRQLRRHRGARRRVARRDRRSRARAARRSSASASACSGCSRAATRRPACRGLGVLPGRIQRLDGDAERRLKIPHVGWNALEFRQAGASARRARLRCAGLLHALVRGAGDERVRRRHHARQHLRLGGRGRKRLRRAVPSREVERRRPADPAQFPGYRAVEAALRRADQTHHRLPRRARRAGGERRAVPGTAPRRRPAASWPAATTCEGIDEVVILDITATLEKRQAHGAHDRRGGQGDLPAADRRRRHPVARRMPTRRSKPAPTR